MKFSFLVQGKFQSHFIHCFIMSSGIF